MENINGDDLDDTGDLDLTAIYTDEDYTGDTVFQNQDEINDILKEREARISELLDHMDEVGGVNRAIAMEMENLEPGIVTRYRSLQSYTEDYSRTNYRETRISLEVLHVAAVAAIAVGVGVLLAAFIGWLLSTFFDDDSGGGGGGKEKKGKRTDERMREIGEAQAESEESFKKFIQLAKRAQGDLKKAMLAGIPEASRKELEAKSDAYEIYLNEHLYKQKLRESYCVYIHEMVDGKSSEHIKFLSELIKILPDWMKQLQEKQHALLELTKEGNKDEIKPEKYFVEIKLAGKTGDMVKSLLEEKLGYYKKICTKGDDQWYKDVKLKTGRAIGTADYLGHLFDQIDDSHRVTWENVKKEMGQYTESIKKANIEKERQAALTQAWRNLKYGYDGAIAGYRIFNQCQAASTKFADAISAAYDSQVKFVSGQCDIVINKGDNDADKKEAEEIKGLFSKVGSKIAGWMSNPFKKKKKKDGDNSTPPAAGATPPKA